LRLCVAGVLARLAELELGSVGNVVQLHAKRVGLGARRWAEDVRQVQGRAGTPDVPQRPARSHRHLGAPCNGVPGAVRTRVYRVLSEDMQQTSRVRSGSRPAAPPGVQSRIGTWLRWSPQRRTDIRALIYRIARDTNKATGRISLFLAAITCSPPLGGPPPPRYPHPNWLPQAWAIACRSSLAGGLNTRNEQ